MWKTSRLSVWIAGTLRPWRMAGIAQLALFVAVEQTAALCRHRLDSPANLSLGAATPVVAAILPMIWAFAAHERLAFRFQSAPTALSRLGLFFVVSWICLDLQALASHLLGQIALGAALVVDGLKFALLRRRVWGVDAPVAAL